MNVLQKPTGVEAPTHWRVLARRRRRFSSGAFLMLFFGLLLWARFILVTGHPRTAVAEPEVAQPAPAVQAAAPHQPARDKPQDKPADISEKRQVSASAGD